MIPVAKLAHRCDAEKAAALLLAVAPQCRPKTSDGSKGEEVSRCDRIVTRRLTSPAGRFRDDLTVYVYRPGGFRVSLEASERWDWEPCFS